MNPLIKLLLCCFALTVFSACGKERISARTEYLSHENLASYYIGTPDPKQIRPEFGQRLIVSWNLPCSYLDAKDLHLHITVRFANAQETTIDVNISETRGTYVYRLINDDYCRTGGIETYKIDLYGGDVILEEWRHQLWVNLINLN